MSTVSLWLGSRETAIIKREKIHNSAEFKGTMNRIKIKFIKRKLYAT